MSSSVFSPASLRKPLADRLWPSRRLELGPLRLDGRQDTFELFRREVSVPANRILTVRCELRARFEPVAAFQCNAPILIFSTDEGLLRAWEAWGPGDDWQEASGVATCLLEAGEHTLKLTVALPDNSPRTVRLTATAGARWLRLPTVGQH